MIALTREVPPALADCELTHLPRRPIDVAAAAAEHRAYEAVLADLGCRVVRLPALPEQPDSVFVEDTAVVVDELAVVARPGAPSRRAETASTEAWLRDHRPLARIEAPACLDGGDVLRVGRRVLVGRSGRTDEEGLRQLADLLRPLGYEVDGVEVRGCLHLKSAAAAIGPQAVLLNPDRVDPGAFRGLSLLEVHPDEPEAANALPIGSTLVCPAGAPRTRRRLEAAGLAVVEVGIAELAKAEAGVTCCSIILT